MPVARVWGALVALGLGLLSAGCARAADPGINIGVLTDLSGIYAELSGEGSVEAARMAVEDFGGTLFGQPIKVLAADHKHSVPTALGILDQWFDHENVGLIVDMPNSAVAIAAQHRAATRGRVSITVTAGSTDLTGKDCTPTGFHWVYDTYSNSSVIGRASVAFGLDRWAFLTADYEFGWSLEAETAKAVTSAHGVVLGSILHPPDASDLSPYLDQVVALKPKVLGIANAGLDTIRTIRQFNQRPLDPNAPTLVPLLVYITDVRELGLGTAQGLTFVTGFYWDLDADTRAFARRFFSHRQIMPTQSHAGVYSAVLHWLRAAREVGSTDSQAVAAQMRRMPVDDFFAQHGTVRADGRMSHQMLLVRVKEPTDSRYPWDYYEVLAKVPGDRAFRPIEESTCPEVKR